MNIRIDSYATAPCAPISVLCIFDILFVYGRKALIQIRMGSAQHDRRTIFFFVQIKFCFFVGAAAAAAEICYRNMVHIGIHIPILSKYFNGCYQ